MPSNNMDADIKKVTAGNWVAEDHDWILIFDICSRVTNNASAVRPAFQCLMKRLRNGTPEAQYSSLVVLETLSSNCGKAFQLELCSREFYDAVFSLWRKRPHPNVLDRLRSLIEELTAAFANDSSLAMMQKLYQDLKTESFPFSAASAGAPPPSTSTSAPSQPSNSLANKEQDDLSRAILLSLQESSTSSGTAASSSQFPPQSSLYPALQSSAPVLQAPTQQVSFKARALYDFQSEDDNEISFKAGELINVLDSSDENWWSGSTLSGSGMFPASFVTRDLTVTPEPEVPTQKTSSSTSNKSSAKAKAKPKPEIREAQIDLLLDMLNNADAKVANEEEEGTLKELEGECNEMKPLLADKIDIIDRERLALQDLNDQFQAALAFYQQLMKETAYSQVSEHAESAPPIPTYSEEYGQAIPAAHHHHHQQQQPQQHTAAAPVYQASPPAAGGYYTQQQPQQAPGPHQQPYAYQPPQQQQQQQPPHHHHHKQQQQQQHHHHQQPPQQQQQQHPAQHGYQEQRFPPPQQQQESSGYFPASGQSPVTRHVHAQQVQPASGHQTYRGTAENIPYHAIPPSQVMPDGSLL